MLAFTSWQLIAGGLFLLPLVIAFERGVAAKQLTNGVLYLGWLAESPDVDDLTFIERTMEAGATLLPLLGELPVRRVMGGLYDNTPDRRPLLGAVAVAIGESTIGDNAAAVEWYKTTLGLPHLFTFGDLAFFDCGGTRLYLTSRVEKGSGAGHVGGSPV